MRLKIVTPEKTIIDTETKGVFVRAIDGELGVLPGHIPLITALDIGVASYTTENGIKEYISIIGGTFKVENDEVLILTETAEIGEDIDETRAKLALDRAKAEIDGVKDTNISKSSPEEERARLAMLRALARLKTIEHTKRRSI